MSPDETFFRFIVRLKETLMKSQLISRLSWEKLHFNKKCGEKKQFEPREFHVRIGQSLFLRETLVYGSCNAKVCGTS